MFVDEVEIRVEAGNGGDGCTAFRREKYISMGGPYGGNGGHGSDIIFKVDEGLHTLLDLRYQKTIKGQKGENGRGKNQHGKGASPLIVKVPLGTVVTDLDTGLIVADLSRKDQEEVIAKGGRGGRGNTAFKTQTNTAPDYSENGEEGERKNLKVEVKMLADVGLVGLPSVGKSTIISCVSRSKPKIAAYHFTTLSPNLGVVKAADKSFVMADLPGLIEGASQGKGLGFQFLRHIERCRVIVHVIDMAATDGRDPYQDYLTIKNELASYNKELLSRPQIIVANKMDQDEAQLFLEEFKEKLGDDLPIFEISAIAHQNVKPLMLKIVELLDKTPKFPLFIDKEDYKVYEYVEEEFCQVKKEDGIYLVYGKPVESLYRRSNLTTDAGILKFIRILRYNGVEEKLKEAGIQDGDTVKVVEYEFEYFE